MREYEEKLYTDFYVVRREWKNEYKNSNGNNVGFLCVCAWYKRKNVAKQKKQVEKGFREGVVGSQFAVYTVYCI